jgi:hypothetical protein
VNIAQLLPKLRIIANVEIVVPLLPEVLRCPIQAWFWLEWEIPQSDAALLLASRLQRIGQRAGWPMSRAFARRGDRRVRLRFTEQHVDMLGHDRRKRRACNCAALVLGRAKKSSFVSGRGFSRAAKPFTFCHSEPLAAALAR